MSSPVSQLATLRFLWSYRLTGTHRLMRVWGVWLLAAVWSVAFVGHLTLGLGVLRAAWEALALFAMGGEPDVMWEVVGKDPAQSPRLATLLWSLRLFAPLVVGGAVVDFLSRLLPEPRAVPTAISGHVVVLGAGRLGYRLAELIRARGLLAVVVDRNPHAAQAGQLRADGVPVIVGDCGAMETLLRAGVDRAAALIAVTGDDLVNESACLLALAALCPDQPDFLAVAHSTDGAQCRVKVGAWLGDGLAVRFDAFDVYEAMSQGLAASLTVSGPAPTLVVGGLGRFGRALLVRLTARFPGARLIGVDRDEGAVHRAQEVAPHAELVRADLLGADALSAVAGLTGEVHLFLVTDDDARNTVAARHMLPLRQHNAGAEIYVRVHDWPVQLEAARLMPGVHVTRMQSLLAAALDKDLGRWLTRGHARG